MNKTFVNTGRYGRIEVEAKGATNTFSPLTNSTFEVLNMAKESLPKNLSIDNLQFTPLPQSKRFVDLTGYVGKFLTVLGYAGRPKNASEWFCRCVCGKICKKPVTKVRNPVNASCGCKAREISSIAHKTHGESCFNGNDRIRTPEYRAYLSAKARCTPTAHCHRRYFDRGIRFLFDSYAEFLAEVGRRPGPDYTLDRENNDGHYEKGNVRWATKSQQQQNKTCKGSVMVCGNRGAGKYYSPSHVSELILPYLCIKCVREHRRND